MKKKIDWQAFTIFLLLIAVGLFIYWVEGYFQMQPGASRSLGDGLASSLIIAGTIGITFDLAAC
jgi:hypothetical protein